MANVPRKTRGGYHNGPYESVEAGLADPLALSSAVDLRHHSCPHRASTRGNDARYAFDSQDFEARGFEFTPPGDVQRQLQELGEAVSDVIERAFSEGIPAIVPQGVAGGMIALIVGLLCLVLLLTAIAIVARQVSEVALIRMVNDHEETGDMLKVRQGFRLGWSRAAWRIFLIDLIINVLLLVAFVVPAAIALLPLLAWTARDTTLGILGTVVAIGLFFLLIFLMIGVVTVVRLLKRFIHRAAALEGLGSSPQCATAIAW